MNHAKLSASLPAEQFAEIERARRREGLKRSQVVQEALAMWLRSRQRREQSEAYVRGYVSHPEDAREALALVQAWSLGGEAEDWNSRPERSEGRNRGGAEPATLPRK